MRANARHGARSPDALHEDTPIYNLYELCRDDVVSVSKREDPAGSFVAVAPVGTGDYWGFPVINGRCSDQVWFRFHDAGAPELAANDFLTFVANRGLTV